MQALHQQTGGGVSLRGFVEPAGLDAHFRFLFFFAEIFCV